MNHSIIPDRFVPKIGEIAIAFSDLDREINYAIWHLLKCPPDLGSAVTRHLKSSTTRIKILRDLVAAKIKSEDENNHFNKLLVATEKSLKWRNRLFHDMPYWFSPTDNAVGFFQNDVHLKPHAPTVVDDQWLHRLLICINFQTSIFRRFRGVFVVVGEPWTSAQIPSMDE